MKPLLSLPFSLRVGKGPKWLPQCLGFAAITLFLLGCPSPTQPPVEGTVVIRGSSIFGEELAHALVAEYQKDHPNVVFVLETKGSASGFAALLAGECDIAAASRMPTRDELQQAKSRGIRMIERVIGSYGVAIIVNSNNPVKNLSRRQVRDVFTGAVRDWKPLGGLEAPVQVCIRDAAAAAHLGFRGMAMENKPYASAAQTFTNYAQLVEAVARDPGGIGYSSMGLARRAGVAAVSIQGVQPDLFSVNEGHYPYARFLTLYTNKQKQTAAATDFIRFVLSKSGQNILEQMGFVPAFEPRLNSYLLN